MTPATSMHFDISATALRPPAAISSSSAASASARWHWGRCWHVGAGHAAAREATDPLAARPPHFAPRAKNVIFLFMAGGPSQLELFDRKPKLQELDGQVIPESFVANKRFAFIKRRRQAAGHEAQVRAARRERADDLASAAAPGRRSPTTSASLRA